jgi:hypothetical protein
MADDDRGRLYLRDTRWYREANSHACSYANFYRGGARLLDTLSTDLLQPSSRFAFWSEIVCRTFTMLDCRVADRTGFRARLCSRSIADISVARVEASASGVARTAGLIRSGHDDSHIVMLQISGSTLIRQGERSRTMCRERSTSCRRTGPTFWISRATSRNT